MGEIAINPIHNVHKKYRQMNLVNPYIFAPPVDLSTNTEIGGVASTISTPALLAAKLAISVGAISNFTVVGSDIKCKITGSYTMPNSAFENNYLLTYYRDIEGMIINGGLRSFRHNDFPSDITLKELYFKNMISMGVQECQYISNCNIYIPNCVTFGFESLIGTNGSTIYCHPSLATSNGGGVDANIASAITSGATVRYVTNFTVPNPISNLSAGTIYSTAIQLNFTPPSSTNTIDYYEVWLNGSQTNKRITTNGQYITGLTASTSYVITLVAVDVFYNKSVASNTLTQSTNTAPYYQQEKMISSYQMENNVNDSIGANNGTATSITYASGLVGQAAVFNGSSSKIANTVLLGYDSFTIIAIIKTSSTAEKIIFSNRNSSTGNTIVALAINSGKLYSRIRSSAGTGITYLESTRTVNNNVNRFVAVTFNKTTGLQSNYIDGTFENSVTYSGGSFSGLNVSSIGVGEPALNYGFWSGNIDEVVVFNTDLTASQIADVYTKLQAGNHL